MHFTPGVLRAAAQVLGISGRRKARGSVALAKTRTRNKKAKGQVNPKFKKRAFVPRNDGQGNTQISHKIGKPVKKLSSSMEEKFRNAIQRQNTQLFQSAGQLIIQNNRTDYQAWDLGPVSDIQTMITNSSSQEQNINGDDGMIHIKDCDIEINLTNMSIGLCNLRVYEFVYRRDLPTTLSSTNNIIQNGFQNAAQNISVNNVANTIFSNPLFCSFCKVMNVRSLQVGAGRTVKLTLSNNKGKTFNPVTMGTALAPYQSALRGWTRGIIIQPIGQVVDDAVTNTISGTERIKLSWVQFRRYHFSQPFSAQGDSFTSGTLGNITTGPELLQPATGAIETYTEA